MPKENKTRYALLGMLTYRPMSGYDMKKMSDHSISHFWNENFGSIYPVLKRMEIEGLVIKNRDERIDGPARNSYTITGEGRRVLTEWLEREPEPRILREELLLQVFYGQWTAPDVILTKLKNELERSEGKIAELRGIKKHLESAPLEVNKLTEDGTPYWLHTVEYGLHYYSGIRDWCVKTIKSMEEER